MSSDKNVQKENRPLLSRRRRGQGLLETTVAFAILTSGITTLMALVVSASVGRMASEKQTVAANLAREAIEAVVHLRNENWIKNQSFDVGFDYGTDYTYAPLIDPWGPGWTMCPDLEAISDPEGKVLRFNDAGQYPGLMYQTVGGVPFADSEETGFRRMLNLDRICYDGTTETVVTSGSSCAGSPGKIGIRVTATVQWEEKNGSHSLSVIEKIYDWR
jgi:type II secretory pathway pseudopilin PulG